ncbi:hypothetical protein KQ305_08440 [Synechococcus sp. CS-1332]|nr:hypothetical protein [Synechococcus sp. CS-1332]
MCRGPDHPGAYGMLSFQDPIGVELALDLHDCDRLPGSAGAKYGSLTSKAVCRIARLHRQP